MSKQKSKTVKVFSGTDIVMCAPSHPVSVVMQIRRTIDRIVKSSDSEFQFNCNSVEGLMMFERYGRLAHGLNVLYLLNGKTTDYQSALADLSRGAELIEEMTKDYKE